MNNLHKYAFSELYDISSGISSTKEQAGHGAPFVSFSTVFNNYFLPDELTDFMDTTAAEQEKCSVKKGDILITRTSETVDELAMSCVVLKDYPKATFSGFVKRLRPKKTGIAYDKYMAFYLRSEYFRKVINAKTIMTLRASFNEDIFSFLELYLPDYEEQVKIGDFLYNIEKKIQCNKKINDNLQQQLKLLYDYWFTQFDFPDENGKPYRSSGGAMVWNEQLKREVPFDWQITGIKEITNITWGQCPDGKNILDKTAQGNNVLDYCSGAGDMKGGFLVDCQAKTDNSKRLAHKNDILVSVAGKIGDMCVVDHTISLGRAAMAYTVEDEKEITFVYLTLQALNRKMTTISTGSIQKVINSDHIDDFIFPYQKDIVLRFGELTQDIYFELIKLSHENRQLKKLRDWLLPMLMNGQATISD